MGLGARTGGSYLGARQGLRSECEQFGHRNRNDCVMLELARKAGHLPLGTFDRNLAKVEGVQKF